MPAIYHFELSCTPILKNTYPCKQVLPCMEWEEGSQWLCPPIISCYFLSADLHVPVVTYPVCLVPPWCGEGLHSWTQVGPIPIDLCDGVGAGAVALRVPPAHAAALAAVLYDLPVRGQQCVAWHLRFPHLQQEPPLEVTWPWGAYGGFFKFH